MSDNKAEDILKDIKIEEDSFKTKRIDMTEFAVTDDQQEAEVKTAEEVLRQKEVNGPMPQRQVKRNAKSKKIRRKKQIIKITLLAVLLLLVVYIAGVIFYNGRLCPNTVIWNVDCSGMSVQKAEEALEDEAANYKLELVKSDGESEYVYGADIELDADVKGKLEPVLDEQKAGLWFIYLFKHSQYHIEASVTYNKELLITELNELDVCNEEKMEEPVDAHVAYDENKKEFYINEGSTGSILVRAKFEEEIMKAVSELQKSLNLQEAGCYKLQEVTADSESLKEQLELVKKYGKIEVKIPFGEQEEILDIVRISKWIVDNEDGKIMADSAKVIEYTQELAAKYDTYDKDRTLHTTYGFDITVEKGDYGWKMDVDSTASKIASAISEGGEQTVEPEWIQTANAFGAEDWGNTFIEVNLTKQHLYYYKDGELVVESDFVSGTVSKARSTPVGIYSIKYKKSPSILRGINWETPVTYWMPFFDGCGLHDATWRSRFGGTIYYYDGSHGCLNMPYNEVKTIYENIAAGVPILIYKTEVEPVEVVPVHETPWPSGYPTEKPTPEPAATEVPVEIVETPGPTPEPTPAPTATPVPADTPEPTSEATAVPEITVEPAV